MASVSAAAPLALRCERLHARLAAWRQGVRQAEVRLAQAQSFLSLAPKAQEVLEEAQRRIQQEIVGGLGDLLTFMLQGVMGDPERRIVCEAEVDARGQSQVRFFVQRASGEREDILAGNGGSIANVVCTGLRLVAVSRAKRARPFLVLDEPDCWLSPDRVGPFVSLLQKAVDAVPGGMQVIMITHHDVHDEGADINTLELLRHDGRVQVRSHIRKHALSGQIERIELRHWRSHEHTVIALGAGLNVLKGANNLGKSAVVEALRCLAYGGARADSVAHGADEASVCVHLTDGQAVLLRRARRGTPAVLYRWTDAQGNVVREEAGARGAGAPPWMEQALGIRLEQGLEIHIADQKKPVFLLDEPAARQTAILSVGQEAQAIVAVLERYKEAKRQAQQMAREAQAQLEAARRLQLALGDMPDWSAQAREVVERSQQLERALERQAQALALCQQMRRLQGLQDAALPRVPQEPAWHDAPRAAALAEQLRRLRALQALHAPALAPLPPWKDSPGAARLLAALRRLRPVLAVQAPVAPALPVLPDVAAARKMAHDLARLRHLHKVKAPQVPPLPTYRDHSAIQALQERIDLMKSEGSTARALLKEEEAQYAAQAEVVRALEAELGACPLCGSPFGKPASRAAVRGGSACDVAAHRAPH